MKFIIPIKTVSEANQREHHFQKYHRKRKQQEAAALLCRQHGILTVYRKGMTVRLTRYGKKFMDADNLAGSFKHVQDQIAAEIGVDDGEVKWEYRQVKGKEFGVEVELVAEAEAAK